MKVFTWLPSFGGFYGSLYSDWIDEEIDREAEYINEQREERGFKPDFKADDMRVDFKALQTEIADEICVEICSRLFNDVLIKGFKFENLVSPKFYNYENDSVNVEFEFERGNIEIIMTTLEQNKDKFKEWLRDRYTSCSGFISSYSNDVDDWLDEECLFHEHKCGAILEFIYEVVLEHPKANSCEVYEEVTGHIALSNYVEDFDKYIETEDLDEV